MVAEALVERALETAQQERVTDVRAGLGYTCVTLEGGGCGLAYTFRNELGSCCGILDAAGSLIGRNASEILPWAKESNRLQAAVGLAAVNAAINHPGKDWDRGNILNAFRLQESDTLGMIGAFHPILAKITMTENIYVFEQNAPEGSGFYPAEAIPAHLPKCGVVVITATSIINHTIDGILPHCKNAREVCLVGPSTPLCPEVFNKYHVTLLAGSIVKNPELMLQIVSQGGGTMSMKPAIEQVLMRI